MLERMDDTVFNLGSCATSRSYYFTNEGDAVILRPTSIGARPQGRRALPDHRLRVRLTLPGASTPAKLHFPALQRGGSAVSLVPWETATASKSGQDLT